MRRVVGTAADDFESMRQKRKNRLKAFGGTALAAGQIHEKRRSPQSCDSAAEPGEAIAGRGERAHRFGKSGNFTVDELARGFGSHIAWAKPRAADSENKLILLVTQLVEQCGDGFDTVRNKAATDSFSRPVGFNQASNGFARSVGLRAGKTAIGDSDHGKSRHEKSLL